MKKTALLFAALCLALAAGTANAYCIYNHVDAVVCVEDEWNEIWGNCKFIIEPHCHYSGGHGEGIKDIVVDWKIGHDRYCTPQHFEIPKGGYARVYQDVVKIYHHDGKEYGFRPVRRCSDSAGPKRP